MKRPWSDLRKRIGLRVIAIVHWGQWSHLRGVENGEYPGKEGGVFADAEQPKHPRQPQQRQQHDGGHKELPVIKNTYLPNIPLFA